MAQEDPIKVGEYDGLKQKKRRKSRHASRQYSQLIRPYSRLIRGITRLMGRNREGAIYSSRLY